MIYRLLAAPPMARVISRRLTRFVLTEKMTEIAQAFDFHHARHAWRDTEWTRRLGWRQDDILLQMMTPPLTPRRHSQRY